MKKLLLTQGVVAAICLTLIGLAVASGHFGDMRRSPLRSDESCQLPCWQGIQPGETSMTNATDMMIDIGYSAEFEPDHNHYNLPSGTAGCAATINWFSATVSRVQLNNCPDLRLGDLLLELGGPNQVAPNLYTFEFSGGMVRAQIRPLRCGERLSPHASVQFLTLTNMEAPQSSRAVWQGFASPWRYRKAMPNVVVLGC